MKRSIEIALGLALAALIAGGVYVIYPNKVTVCVANRSELVNPVDIRVVVDGSRELVNEKFAYGGKGCKSYEIGLSRATHKLYAVSINGAAELHQGFKVSGRGTIYVDYAGRPNFRTMGSFDTRLDGVSDQPLKYMNAREERRK